MTLQDKRKQRISILKEMIKQASLKGKICDYNKLLSIFCMENSVSIRLAKEYLELLISCDEVIQKGDEIYYNNEKDNL